MSLPVDGGVRARAGLWYSPPPNSLKLWLHHLLRPVPMFWRAGQTSHLSRGKEFGRVFRR